MIIIGHRGAGDLAPENSVKSIVMAQKLGANMIEFDVQVTRDNHLILMHDVSLFRTTGDTRFVSDLALEDLSILSTIDGQPIPTLTQALRACGNTPAVIEGKGKRWAAPLIKTLAETSLPWAPIVIAYDADELYMFQKSMPHIKTYLLNRTNPFTAIQEAKRYGFSGINLLYWMYNPFVYLYAKHLGLGMIAFTLRPRLTRFFHMLYPCVWITTNRPDLFSRRRETPPKAASTKH